MYCSLIRDNACCRWLLVAAVALSAPGAFAAEEETDAASEEVYELSPFSVETSDEDIGYYASSTLSGTRMNSRLRDLAASITVVTAQQLEDTASVDINDVFMYEANTEGTHTYTDYSTDRFGFPNDSSIQTTPETANRVRGMGSPDRAVDYFISLSAIPFDAYNTDRLTINRGPNSVLYGLGSAAGLINTSLARANIGTDSNRVDFRYGSWDDLRSSFSVNRTLIEDKLAVRVAALYHDRGFPQEPSYDYTRRVYGALTYRPFENTTIRASYEDYNSDAMRPNALTPGDAVSHWMVAGSPTFNPSTMMVTRNGQQFPITGATGEELDAASNTGLTNHPRSTIPAVVFEDGEFLYQHVRRIGSSESGFGTQLPERMLVGESTPNFQQAGNWFTQGVSDKSIYNWEKINLRTGNFAETDAEMLQFMLEQQVTDDFFFEVGWRREDLERYSLGAWGGGSNRIYVDVNETLLDGTPNPTFLSTFMEGWEPTASTNKTLNEALRGTAVYELDFTENDGWSRWLGRHNLMGFGERREITNQFFRWREAVISEHDWTGEPGSIHFTGNNARDRLNRMYVVGENGFVNKAPMTSGKSGAGLDLMGVPGIAGRDYPQGVIGGTWNAPITYFRPTYVPDGDGGTEWAGRDGATDYPVPGGRPIGEWVTEETTMATILHDAATNSDERIESFAAVVQSSFWEDRIITTLGWREDTRKGRFTPTARDNTNESGFLVGIPEALRNFSEWDEVTGRTNTKGVVVHPFRHWDAMPEFVQSLSAHYNESDTFAPANLNWNLFREPLPLPTGVGKDYGVGFSLFDNKLIARVNWYEAEQANARTGTGTLAFRSLRIDHEPEVPEVPGWGMVHIVTRQAEMRHGVPRYTWNVFGDLDAIPADVQQEIATEAGFDSPEVFGDNWDGGPSRNDTVTTASEGMEISLDYNPTRQWNVKFTAGQQETFESEVIPNTFRYLVGEGGTFDDPQPDGRKYHWMRYEYVDQRDLPEGWQPGDGIDGIPKRSWWNPPPGGVDGETGENFTPEGWYNGVVEGLARVSMARQGLSNPQVREWRWSLISNYRFTEGALDGLGVGGAVRWEDKGSMGYMAERDPVTGEPTDFLDPFAPIWDDDRYYFDFWASYNTRIMDDRVRLRVQLNLRDAFRSPGLRVVGVNSDGSNRDFRIENGRQWFLSTTFDF